MSSTNSHGVIQRNFHSPAYHNDDELSRLWPTLPGLAIVHGFVYSKGNKIGFEGSIRYFVHAVHLYDAHVIIKMVTD